MASSSAVQSKTPFLHLPFQRKAKQPKNPAPVVADGFESAKGSANLNKLPKNAPKAQALAQGDEAGRKGGLWDCLGLFGLIALCCFCCEGSGNGGGYRNRGRWANEPRNKNNANHGTPAA